MPPTEDSPGVPHGTLRALRERVVLLARHPRALAALFIAAILEASLVPVPPDLLFVPLALARPRRIPLITAVCVAGSVTGAMIGYLIGATLFREAGEWLIAALGASSAFDRVLALYRQHMLWTLLAAGFTSIPFSVFTIAAGFRGTLSPLGLLAGAFIGRVVRFSLLGGLLWAGGPLVRRMIDRHLGALAFLALLALLGSLLLGRLLP